MTFDLPPGISFLLQIVPKQLLPLTVVFILQKLHPDLLEARYGWLLVYVFAIPLTLFAKYTYRNVAQRLDMRKLGARPLPSVPSTKPGGIDLISQSLKSFNEGYIGDLWQTWMDTVGPTYKFAILGQEMVITTEPENIKAILATEFNNFEKGEIFRGYAQSVLGTGVFNADGERWKFHRAITRPFFVRERVTDFETFNRHANVAVAKMKDRFAQGEAIDFQDVMSRFTLDSATEFLFGSCVHSLSAELPYAWNSSRHHTVTQPHSSDKFAVAFTHAQYQIALRSRRMTLWRLSEFWKDKTKDDMNTIFEYIDPIIKEALAKKMAKTAVDTNKLLDMPKTLLDHLVEQTDEQVVIRDETLNIMIAGRDTTMATLTFAIYSLSQNPHVLAKLREEILTVVGRDRMPTIEDVRECKYLRAVINETLRLYPPVPFDARHTVRSTTWRAPDGGKPYYIPGKVDVAYAVFIMHRRKDLWGPDADKFDPDRFLDERVHKYLTPNPFIFLPFNAGPRICLGQQFAYNETSFMLVRLLQNFATITLDSVAQPPESRPPAVWKTAKGTQATDKMWVKSHLTAYSFKGLWLRMTEAPATEGI